MLRSRQTDTSPANRASPAHVIRPKVCWEKYKRLIKKTFLEFLQCSLIGYRSNCAVLTSGTVSKIAYITRDPAHDFQELRSSRTFCMSGLSPRPENKAKKGKIGGLSFWLA